MSCEIRLPSSSSENSTKITFSVTVIFRVLQFWIASKGMEEDRIQYSMRALGGTLFSYSSGMTDFTVVALHLQLWLYRGIAASKAKMEGLIL